MRKNENVLSLGACLSALYELSRHCHKNQVLFFKSLFPTFHRIMSEKQNFEFELNQGRASQVLNGRELLPRAAYLLYLGPQGDQALKSDVAEFLSIIAVSYKQKDLYYQKLLELVLNSTNLYNLDKQYILSCIDGEEHQPLNELLFRTLHILIREPLSESA